MSNTVKRFSMNGNLILDLARKAILRKAAQERTVSL